MFRPRFLVDIPEYNSNYCLLDELFQHGQQRDQLDDSIKFREKIKIETIENSRALNWNSAT